MRVTRPGGRAYRTPSRQGAITLCMGLSIQAGLHVWYVLSVDPYVGNTVSACLAICICAQKCTASTGDGVCMAIQHVSYPMVRIGSGDLSFIASALCRVTHLSLCCKIVQAAVQFHPESIMTPHNAALRMLTNVMQKLK